MSKFFEFNQNNSGGGFYFDEEAGITHHVIIEAKNAEGAIHRAEGIGLYWDGVADGYDCACCGDRWYPPYGDAGTDQPEHYGTPFKEVEHIVRWMNEGKEICVHYLDGRKEWA